MTRINVIYDIGLDYLTDDIPLKPPQHPHNKKQRLVKMTNDDFNNLMNQGLIRKTDDGYVFVGKRPKK
ncbi:MAG: hypothetical protein KKC68_08395 [Candidatus Thermoplasmatota archaeon]|nr:hypothetical protein [Candidatus Thermoplasmatota archaeon]MBU1941779.1 hypothetical protein [Candidatus Thermoplasmatota archaeon]